MNRTSDDHLARAARQRHARYERWQAEGESSLGRNLAMIGAYGWLVVIPAVGGALLGRWLDTRLGTGITASAALVLLGAGAGLWMVWLRMNEDRLP